VYAAWCVSTLVVLHQRQVADQLRSLPLRLSAWDEAFLASLYEVDQGSVVEQPMMKRQMVSSLAPSH
jgi:hypothetical protein